MQRSNSLGLLAGMTWIGAVVATVNPVIRPFLFGGGYRSMTRGIAQPTVPWLVPEWHAAGRIVRANSENWRGPWEY